jgi:predicted nuclease of predicted toxin-antitoxin system
MSKFLVDAQRPRRLANRLQAWGYDAIHTLDLPEQNKTPDEVINSRQLKGLSVAT